MCFQKNDIQNAGMNFIKKHFLKKYISDRKVVRNINVASLPQATKVGLLCNITTEDTYKDIYAVFSSLQHPNRSIWLMGYIDDKMVPFYCLQQLSADFFCNKDLNWYGKPEKVQIEDFIKSDFDVLIDFSQKPHDPIRLILNLSHAHFIVGSLKDNAPFYDLLIHADQQFENKELLRHINHYTQQLKGEKL